MGRVAENQALLDILLTTTLADIISDDVSFAHCLVAGQKFVDNLATLTRVIELRLEGQRSLLDAYRQLKDSMHDLEEERHTFLHSSHIVEENKTTSARFRRTRQDSSHLHQNPLDRASLETFPDRNEEISEQFFVWLYDHRSIIAPGKKLQNLEAVIETDQKFNERVQEWRKSHP